jgi:serine/threonine protein kinase
MNSKNGSPELEDSRVVAALDEYLAALEAGERPSRQAFLARHAAIAGALAECLEGMDALQLASTAPHAPAGTAGERPPTALLGDFRIVREIGRGGMGMVYEAEQLSLGRRVALKVLPFAAALDARQLQRFKNEAQAAALLHHPHIVPVHAVGSERGLHFYAMQLIQGQSLAELIAQLRQRAAPGADGAPPSAAASRSPTAAQLSTERSERPATFFRTVARLMAQAAEGLDYAHEQGVIHRDIKPANLLVDEHAHVWLTDFGLAQCQASSVLTQSSDLLGTLRYMSPEQAGGQRTLIDHRTDVYALGATLYELLTLRPLFDGADRQTLLQQILHQEPVPPRSVDRTIPAELETVFLKAVSKAPADRYASACDFADDLNRFLRDEPIRARRATLPQRARKWLRRHPSVLAAGIVLLILLTAASVTGIWLLRREQARTQQAYQRELQLARHSVDQMIRLAQEELADNPQLQGLRQRLLEEALVYYQEFLEQRRDDPDAQADLALTQDRVKKILDDLAVLQGAGQLSLLSDPAVLDDLRLSEEQRVRVDELVRHMEEQRQEAFQGYQRLTAAEREQRFLDLARKTQLALAAMLSAEKLRRLHQIDLQVQGPRAFADPEVAAALHLTAEQSQRIAALSAGPFLGGPSCGPGMGKPPRTQGPAPSPALENIKAVLTPEQARRWQELTGEPFQRPPRRHLGPPPEFPGPRHKG